MNETRKCEYCGKDINIKYTTCPLCGGHLHEVIAPVPAECPRCRNPLELHRAGDEEYDLCRVCGGMWLDKGEFHLVTREYDVYKGDFKGEYLRGPAKDPVEYLPCVRCGKIMNRKNFARISGVIIDECSRHGVW